MEENKSIYVVINELDEWVEAVFDDEDLANDYIKAKNGFDKIGNSNTPKMSIEVYELNPTVKVH